ILFVVFIGPGQYKKSAMRNMFQVCKYKIWAFLVWLKDVAKNPLYQDIVLDKHAANIYSEDAALP
ncbi:hypothetical protein C0993_010980, partial [Termitomyces sp. T159_Od127]